jgi:hypothetical protein
VEIPVFSSIGVHGIIPKLIERGCVDEATLDSLPDIVVSIPDV